MTVLQSYLRMLIFNLLLISTSYCKNPYTPKPLGYMMIDFPEKAYQVFDSICPYTFEYPVYGMILPDDSRIAEKYWINIYFPQFDGTIHISYKEVNNNLDEFIEDSRTLAYKHTIKADAIREVVYTTKERNVYGLIYEIKGNAASSTQFYLTDSINHFLRGSLYFNVQPNVDSLAPVITFFREDIEHMIETFEWKNQ